jgi:hypothetical protein
MTTTPAPAGCAFSLEHYREICALLTSGGYRFVFYPDELLADPAAPAVLMRHDIDQSLEAAERLAQLERSLGVRATYFVWLTSPFYNCFDPEQRALLHRILGAGHEVGLHFDAMRLEGCSEDRLEREIVEECALLERVVDRPVTVVSFHRPRPEVINRDFLTPGYTNAYGRRFTEQFKYMSDSGRNWREGCVCQRLRANTAPPRLHLLTHAFWWTGTGDTIAARGREFLAEKSAYVDAALAANIKGYTRQL